MTLVVNHKILAMLGESESREIHTLNGIIYSTEERHYLHRLFGRITKDLMPFVTKHPITNKAVQELVSARQHEPLVALGFLEYAKAPHRSFDLHLIVDNFGNLLQVNMTNEQGIVHIEKDELNRELTVQDFVYRCIGKFYTKKGA